MFDISFGELLIVGVVALVVIGPERLPRVARTAGHMLGRLQRYVAQVKSDISREMELAELRQLQSTVEEAARDVEKTVKNQMQSAEEELRGAEAELRKAEDEVRRAAAVPVPDLHMGTMPAGETTAAAGTEVPLGHAQASGDQPHADSPEPFEPPPQLELGLERGSKPQE